MTFENSIFMFVGCFINFLLVITLLFVLIILPKGTGVFW